MYFAAATLPITQTPKQRYPLDSLVLTTSQHGTLVTDSLSRAAFLLLTIDAQVRIWSCCEQSFIWFYPWR